MEINEETYGLFDRYFTGNLSAEERMDFEKALAVDEKFRDEFQWLNSAVSEIRMNGSYILKKQLAEIGAAIPASAFEKYTPSIKPKSFFKKWWWAIAVIIAAAGLAIAWLAMRGPEGNHFHPFSNQEGVSEADVPVADDFMKQPQKDSAAASSGDKSQFTDAPVLGDGESLFDECRSFSVRAPYKSDVQYSHVVDGKMVWSDTAYPFIGIASGSDVTLTVECCPQNSKPAFYSYQNRITLSAAYADTSGLRFVQHGTAVWMTDGKPGYFILTKGENEKPLERLGADKEDEAQRTMPDKKPAKPKINRAEK